uniref:ATP synthase subunit a n=1 Tax=Coleoptera sp. ACP-2013 TaxID=2485033 RepID=A0A3G3MEU0_9COLE|nr:ATP synthase F0 subunit 6 [Coleoptera sp. ACP-2013]
MMMNLFSSFDPSSNFNMSLNWFSSFLGLFIIPPMFWFLPSRFMFFYFNIINILHKEFKILMNNPKMIGSTLIFIVLFMIIMFNNFLGLIPYIFTSTSHLVLTLSLALPLWLTFMIYGWLTNTIHMLAHLVPQGTPPILMMFMVCIETISNMIRPGTLAIRLSANMIAGHLLMTLLGNTGPMMSMYLINLLLIIQLLLITLETAVALIQSYVFAILSTLYSSETN